MDLDADLPAEIALLAAEREIRAALARYCRGIDRMEAELVRSVYHPDAHDDHIVEPPRPAAPGAIRGRRDCEDVAYRR
jgi:hypothetical protein